MKCGECAFLIRGRRDQCRITSDDKCEIESCDINDQRVAKLREQLGEPKPGAPFDEEYYWVLVEHIKTHRDPEFFTRFRGIEKRVVQLEAIHNAKPHPPVVLRHCDACGMTVSAIMSAPVGVHVACPSCRKGILI